MRKRLKAGRGSDLNGFLGEGCRLEGDLHFEDTFRVDGEITGSVVSRGALLIGESGRVDGDVRAARCVVAGRVEGRIYASERVEIAAGAQVHADLETAALVIEEGGLFDGHCTMNGAGAPVVSHPSADPAASRRSG